MVYAALAAAAAVLLVPAVSAQAAAYAQCGGTNWTGATTCVSGFTCVYSNEWYSQCVPGTATTTGSTTSKPTTTTSTTKTTSSTSTAPSSTSSIDTSNHCGQYEQVVAGPYSLNTDLWGESGATSGSQCSHWISLSGTTAAFSTTWTWNGGNGVKSFSDIQLNQGLGKSLSTIKTIPSTAKWTNTASGSIVADVAYDLFTSATPGGSNAYEIMIWLANYNAGPISSAYGATGAPTPVASNLSIGGYTWNLYYGSNGYNYVYSFLPVSGTIPSFSADINLFLKYLTTSQSLPASQYLTTLQFGTEPTTGSATLTVSAYSAVIN